MIREEDLDAAVAEGIIDARQAAGLRALAQRRTSPPAIDDARYDPDDEKFRLIGGFNDVFVTIGVLLLVAALFGLSGAVGFRLGFALIAFVAAWGLAEIFSRRMRLALPSIALSLMFAGSAAYFGMLGTSLFVQNGDISLWHASSVTMICIGLAVAAAAVLHEIRFRVPIDSAIAAAGVICAITGALFGLVPGWANANLSLITAAIGIGVFLIALRVDASDPERRTRRADIAFWLHLLAAPLIVHPVLKIATGGVGANDTAQSLTILLVFAMLGVVALIIDRRALLVSGLTYAGGAIAYLLSQSSFSRGTGLSLTLLGLALLVLSLSAGWRRLRRSIVPLLPLGGLKRYVPPTHATDVR